MLSILDHGLDDVAAGAHATAGARAAATVAVGVIAFSFLPWPVCVVWLAVMAVLEGASWFVTRQQFLGRAVSNSVRLQHVICLVGGVVGWVLLSTLFWRLNTAVGGVCAVILWLSVMAFAQVYAYQSRAGYLLAGLIPAASILATPLIWPNPAIPGGATMWGLVLIAVAFSFSGARQTIAVRRGYDQANQKLRDSELSYRLLADNVTDVISMASADNQRLYVSPSIERILGFSPGELLRTPNYAYMHPEDSEMVQAFIRSTTVETGPQTIDYRVFAKDGSVIWTETTFSRLNDGSGRLLGVSRDITHRKALEGELIDALARSEAAAAAKTDFLANMTHELRTPLTAILGFSGLLRQSAALSERDARQVGLINDASQTLLGVIGDILDFSKLEAGGLELDPEPFDPAAMARSTAAIVADQAAAKGLSLTVEVDDAMPALVGDAARLRQVLLNFLSNAIKFTRAGRVELALSYRTEAEVGRLCVEVRDSGIGVEAGHIDQLFARFTQADASVSRRFGGTGLGLAISKQIVETMGGRIGATSVAGEGSTFWFEVGLPLAGDWTAAVEPDHASATLERPIHVLVVEDNAVNRELIAALLSPFEIRIDTACDGAEAIEAIGRQRYDVILMDVQMPVMDGLTATRRIRAMEDSATTRTPIVAMTANVLPEQVARCREAGMDDHLGKPINPARLLQALDRWTSEDAQSGASETSPEAEALAS